MIGRACDAANRALDSDIRKAATSTADENIKAALVAVQHRRLPSAVAFALKACEKQHADGHTLIGEALLDLGMPAVAEAVLAKANNSKGDPRLAVARIAALMALHRQTAEVRAACDEARKLCTASEKQHGLELARLQAFSGSPDEACENARLVAQGLQPGDGRLNSAALLASECELQMYAEAAWPQCAAFRPDRHRDKEKPAAVDLPTWRLQRGIEAAHAHVKRVPQCVGASVLAAEMLLEGELYRDMWRPEAEQRGGGGGGDASGGGGGEESSAEREEIRALMLMSGVTDDKMDDPMTALRVIERQRRRVVDSGGPHAMVEADELSKLHEWQMNAIARSRHLAAAAVLSTASKSDSSSSVGKMMSEAEAALGLCEAALKNVDGARSSPDLCLLRGRLHLHLGQPFDATAPLAAASTLLAPEAAWQGGVLKLAGANAATGGGGAAAMIQSKPEATELYLAAQMYLGLALAADGGIKKFDEFAPRLRSALAHLDSRLPPPDETAQLLSNDRTSGGAEAPVAGEVAAAGKVGDGREEEAQEAEDEIAGREASRDECSICLQPFRPSDTVKVLPCSHAFHSAPCLHRWFRRSRCCPVCREPWVEFSPVGRPLVRCLLSPVNPDIFVACRRLAAAQVERGQTLEACNTCELAERIFCASLAHLGGAGAERASGGGEEGGGDEPGGGAAAIPLTLELSRVRLVYVRALVVRGFEPAALRLCERAVGALHEKSAATRDDDVLSVLLRSGGLLVDRRAKDALAVFEELSSEWTELAPHCAAAQEALAAAHWLAFDADPLSDASSGGQGERQLQTAKACYERALALEGKRQGHLDSSVKVLLRARREAKEAAAAAEAAAEEAAAKEAAEKAKADADKAAAADKSKSKGKGKPQETRGGLKATAGKAVAAKGAASALSKGAAASKGSSKGVAGSGAAAAKALAATTTTTTEPSEGKQDLSSCASSAAAAPAAAPAAAAPSAEQPSAPASVAAVAPLVDAAASSSTEKGGKDDDDEISAEELAAAVALAKSARTEGAAPEGGPLNGRSVGARLGLVQVSRALGEPLGPLRSVLEEALREDETARHDCGLYEELGRILRQEDPMAAVDLYCSFPFTTDHDFGENSLRLAAIKTLLAQKQYDDERLKPLLVSIGKGFGVRQIESEVDVLSRAGKTQLCKDIYMSVTGLTEENSRGFFQSKGWLSSFTSSEVAAGSLQGRLSL